MNSDALKESLKSWSDKNQGEQAELALKIAQALDDAELKSRWSLIDIRREFESRSNRYSGWHSHILNLVSVIHTASYLLPIGFTWWHLSDAMRSFRRASDSVDIGDNLNFLSFWTGADNSSYSGMKLQTVGIWIIGLLFVPIFFNFLLNLLDDRRMRVSAELNSLILSTQLEISTARTITPEALADALSDSTTKLDVALGQMTKAVTATEQTLRSISGLTSSLELATSNSSKTLASASTALEQQIKNLETSFSKISEVVGQLGTIGQDISTAGRSIKAIGDLTLAATQVEGEVTRSLVSAKSFTDELSKISSAVKTDLSSLSEQMTSQINVTNELLKSLSVQISPLVSNLKTLGQVTDDNKPAILHLGDVVVATKRVVDEMHSIVNEFAIAASRNPTD